MKARIINIILLTGLLLVCGCGTTGKDFNESLYKNIVAGTTIFVVAKQLL